MYHFFVTPAQISAGDVIITGPDVNHIRNVLRLRQGDRIGVRDGISRSYVCGLEEIGTEQIRARILSADEADSELPARLYLFQGLPKGDKMELIIQKAVELGVCQIIPVATRRAVVKLEGKRAENKIKRWNAIAESAAKQSGRLLIPEVTRVMTLKEVCSYAGSFDLKLMPYELAEGMAATREIFGRVSPGMQIGILIGPEGGFDREEAEDAAAAGFKPVTLGRRILRTETAGMAVLSILGFWLEQ